MKVWLNGRFVPAADATVSLFDAGFQHGVGVFSSMCARHGVVFRIMEHLQRLQRSAIELGALEVLRLDPLADAIELTLRENNMVDARVRITVTAGDLKLLKTPGVPGPPARGDPTIAIVAQPLTPYPTELFERGVRVRIADAKLNDQDPFSGHKTLWYWPRLAELQLAAASGCSEAIFFTVNNRAACGAVSNLFVVKEGVVKTPRARGEGESPSPVLKGVTRSAVIECAQQRGIAVETADITAEELLCADEVFLTNSSWGVLPVVAIEKTGIGAGTPGELTQALRRDYLELVEAETSRSQMDSIAPTDPDSDPDSDSPTDPFTPGE